MTESLPTYPARLLVSVLACTALACGGDDLTLPNEGQPSDIRAVRGNGQNGTIGEPLADSLVVRVEDRFGNPVPGIEVSWVAEDGGTVDPSSAITGNDGRAGAQRVLGMLPGTYTTIARTAALPDAPVIFTTTAVAARLSLTTQPSPSAAAGEPFERQPVLQLLDPAGAPIARAGVTVTVQIATGGGTLGGATSRATDDAGTATFIDLSIRGSPGTRTLIFAADGFASATSGPVAIGVGAAAGMAAVEGDGQTAAVNTTVPVAPAVVIRDADGNPVPGVPVHFTVAAGGGALTGGTAVSGADGVARVGSWRLGTAAGENRLLARVEGAELAGAPVAFTATGTPGPVSPSQSSLAAAPTTIAASDGGSASTITVTARDEFGNPVPGLTVTLAATGNGHTLTQPEQPTSGSGEAAGRLSATVTGTRTVSAQIDGVALAGTVTVTVSPGPPSPASSTASVGDGTAGSPTTISVQLLDQFGNRVAGQSGKVSASVTGANTRTVVQAEDQGGGTYLLRYTPSAVGEDQIVVRIEGTPLASGALTSRISPGASDPSRSSAQLPSSWRLFNNGGPIPVLVTVRDAQGNLRAGLTDAVTVQVDGATPPIQATANGDGTYSASFPPPRLGQVPVVIEVNGQAIAGSPFVVNITLF